MDDQKQAGDNIPTAATEVKLDQAATVPATSNEIAEAAQAVPNVIPPANGAAPSDPDGTTQTSPDVKTDPAAGITKDQWEKRESELLEKISNLEKVKSDVSLEGARLELKVRAEENEILKARILSLESELAAALTRPGTKNQEMVDNIKKQHDELLVKARGMIFDKTKMVKNQELQIEALSNQVASLKDVANITKDLLNIRNTEVKHLEERLETMEEKFRIEKERHQLIMKKIDSGTKMNEELKKEYETQLSLFKELRGKYEERVVALQEENRKLLESIDKPAASTSQ